MEISKAPINTPQIFGFGGNPNLKAVNTPMEFTAEQMQEYIRCAQDPIHFIKKYVKVISLDSGIVKLDLRDYQEDVVNTCIKERFVICKMPRQAGKSTTIAAIILWHILFKKEYTCAILANKLDQAQEIIDRIQMSYENLPMWMQQGIVSWNKRSIRLENGSRVFCTGTSSSAIRGKSVNLVYMDELAHIDGTLQQKFYTSTYPVISSGKTTKVIITSTPNGFDLFAKIWFEAIDRKEKGLAGGFTPIEVHWTQIPGRDEAWKEETIANTSEMQFRQEHECAFLGSADTLIDPNKIATLVKQNPLRHNDSISVFEEPVKGRTYAIVADVSRGGGGDYSAFVVADVTSFPYKVVATYRNNLVSSLVYPNYIDRAARMYNDAMILVETNDIGKQIADILHYDLENEGVLMTSMNGRKGQTLGGGFGAGVQIGVKTTKSVKRIGCSALKALIENDKLIVHDYQIISELSTFVMKGSSYEAQYGSHDDLVMCLVLFSWMTTQAYFREVTDSDIRTRILEDQERFIEDDLTPFGLMDDGHDVHENTIIDVPYDAFEDALR